MSVKAIEVANSANFFASVRESASKGAVWLSSNAKTAASNVAVVAKNVGASVSAIFAVIAQKLSAWFSAGRDAAVNLYGKVSGHVRSLSPEMRMGAAGLAIGAAVGAFLYRCAKTEAPEKKEAVNEAEPTPADTDAAPKAEPTPADTDAAAAAAAAAAAPAK